MIRINLLPPELRRTVGTPPIVFGIAIAGIGLLAAIGCLYLYLWLNMLVLDEERTGLAQQVEQKKLQAEERNALQDDIKDYKERERIIVQIKTNRILWSRKLDALVRLTPDEIWITRLQVKKPDETPPGANPQAKQESGGYLELQCYALGAKVTTMTEFRRRLMGEPEFWRFFLEAPLAPNEFSYRFATISQPSWDSVRLEGFREENNIPFTIRMDLEPGKTTALAEPATL